jgi:hypothetical protein
MNKAPFFALRDLCREGIVKDRMEIDASVSQVVNYLEKQLMS